jgi:hypothetical protein
MGGLVWWIRADDVIAPVGQVTSARSGSAVSSAQPTSGASSAARSTATSAAGSGSATQSATGAAQSTGAAVAKGVMPKTGALALVAMVFGLL